MSETSPESSTQEPETNPAPGETTTTPAKRKEAPNPFDLPFVFSGLLLCLAVWFGYDGWFNPKIESIMFNRIMFGLFIVGGLFTAYVDFRSIQKRPTKSSE